MCQVPRAVCLEGSLESARHQQVETIKSNQRGVEMTASESKGLAIPAVLSPPLPEPGEEVVQQSREAVTRKPEGSEIIIKSEARDSVSGFQCNEAEEIASRRPKGCSEDYSHSRHDFRGTRKERKAETYSESKELS